MVMRMLGRRPVLALIMADLASSAWPLCANADNVVLAPIHRLIEGLQTVMKAGRSITFSQRFNMLAPVIDQTFDLTTILKQSVGANWQSLPLDQQDTLLRSFRRYTIASYVSSFDEYNGQRFLVNPETRIVGNDQVVQTQILPSSGDGHKLDYVMQEGSEGWRIVDVLADGAISRVAVQRSDFRQLIRRGGAAALAQNLETKAANLSG